MKLEKAIEYLMEEPDYKTPHREQMERDFFESSGLKFNANIGEVKSLVLELDSIDDLWCNGMLWLGIIYDHVTVYDEMEYSIRYTIGGTSMEYIGTERPSLVLRRIRREHISWDVLASYEVVYDGFVTECGEYIPPNTTFTIIVVDNETLAYTSYGTIDIDSLVTGEVIRIY